MSHDITKTPALSAQENQEQKLQVITQQKTTIEASSGKGKSTNS